MNVNVNLTTAFVVSGIVFFVLSSLVLLGLDVSIFN